MNTLETSTISRPTPHLLTLPRELRDIIYSYLHRPTDLFWAFSILPFPRDGHAFVPIRAAQTPLLNVLLSCTQLHDEYIRSTVFWHFTVTVRPGILASVHPYTPERVVFKRAGRIMERAVCVEFQMETLTTEGLRRTWWEVENISQFVIKVAPRLREMRAVAPRGDVLARVTMGSPTADKTGLVHGAWNPLFPRDEGDAYCNARKGDR